MKTLVFEGAGWDNAPAADVGNCRIRTRIENNAGIVIYLEVNGFERNKYQRPPSPFAFTGHVSHCFSQDENEVSEWRNLQGANFEYTAKSLLQWVNLKLNCSFDSLQVVNDGSVQVHDKSNPVLCSSKL